MEELPDKGRTCLGRHGRRLLARFVNNRGGSTAIEFSILALPFAALVFAIIESCISFAGQEVLTNTADDIARQMRTGQIRPPVNEIKLREMICGRLEVMVAKGCPGLAFDLREVTTFAEAAGLGNSWAEKKVELGKATRKNVLRITYAWPAITNYAHWLNDDTRGAKPTTHFAMAVWQNEPFND